MSSESTGIRGYFESITPPSVFSLKRAATGSTKNSSTTNDSSTSYSYYNFPSYNQHSGVSDGSTLSRSFTGTMEGTIDTECKSIASKRLDEEETLPSLLSEDENDNVEDDSTEYDDQIIEANTKNRSLALDWTRVRTVPSSWRTVTNKNSVTEEVCELPEGISKSDITVTIDIDDEARSSRVDELDEEDLDVEILHYERRDSGADSPRKDSHRQRLKFEETVSKGIHDDLKSLYTATPKTAKFVLCVVVSVLSDGTLDHTFWSGGRVGLTEIVLQWVLFDADDLQVYKRGRVVQKKDFGFGPLGLTDYEGQYYLATTLAPRATSEIISKIGNGGCQNLLVEI